MRRSIRLELASDQREGAVARRVARAALSADGPDEAELRDVELVTAELFSNAVKASNIGDGVSIGVTLNDTSVLVSVSNRGEAFELHSERATLADVGGRGLEIARAIGDTQVRHDHGLTTVTVAIGLAHDSTRTSGGRLRPSRSGGLQRSPVARLHAEDAVQQEADGDDHDHTPTLGVARQATERSIESGGLVRVDEHRRPHEEGADEPDSDPSSDLADHAESPCQGSSRRRHA